MNTAISRMMHWTPRILGVLQAAFISIFALDAWSGDAEFWDKLAGFGIHLVPTAGLVIALIIAWRWELTGGFLLIVMATLGTLLLRTAPWTTHALILLPVFIVGVLFAVDWAHQHHCTQPERAQ